MKRITLISVVAGVLCALPGCNNSLYEDQMLKPRQAEALQPMQQSWRGVLPCADCGGIERSLFLEKDGSWVMNERYLNAPKNSVPVTSYGAWARTAERLVLTDSNGKKSYYRVRHGKLEILNHDGTRIISSRNPILEPVKSGNAQPEHGYAEARGRRSKPVILIVEGYDTLAPGETVKVTRAQLRGNRGH